MYKLEKCNIMPRRMLTVTPEKNFHLFLHFVLDFSVVLVYTCSVIREGEYSERMVRSAPSRDKPSHAYVNQRGS